MNPEYRMIVIFIFDLVVIYVSYKIYKKWLNKEIKK